MRKVLEAFFRHKWLVLLPPLLIPVLVTPISLLATPVAYESIAGVWVDNPTYLDPKGTAASSLASAAQSQSTQLTELLHTRSFMLDVVGRTGLASIASTPSGEAKVADLMDKGVTVAAVPNGSHLLTIRARFATPQLSQQVAQAIVDAYSDRSSNQLVDQSSTAISFYQSQLDSAQDDATKANQDLSQYAIAMGYAPTGDGTTVSTDTQQAQAFDPQFADLQAKAHFAQQQVDQARAALQNAQQRSAAAAQGADQTFQVIDPPQLPTAPVTQTKNVLVFGIAGLVVGLGLSGIVLVLLVASDRSIRQEADLQPPVRVLGALPMLKLKQRVPKSIRGSATRRAIGFVAGTALPAPRGSR
jgi:uncharacterized protein involved in exopolysaccharide biosynthesis